MDSHEFYSLISEDEYEGVDAAEPFVDDDLDEEFELEITHEILAAPSSSRQAKRPREEEEDDERELGIIRPAMKPPPPMQTARPAVAVQTINTFFMPTSSSAWPQTNEEDRNAAAKGLSMKEMEKMPLIDLANTRVFGNTSFRPLQREVIEAAGKGEDVFLLMPTGGGKSLCYQLPAVVSRGVTVVVCPLLSLMQDQVQALCLHKCGGIPATFLSSQQTKAEAVAVLRELSKPQSPTIKLLYVTPEQICKSQALVSILTKLSHSGLLARFVIDEAHCVSSWGHDFRSDYKEMGKVIKESFPAVPVTAVTATATEAVAKDVLKILGIQKATVFRSGFLRENLLFQVVDKQYGIDEDGRPQPISQLVDFIIEQGAGGGGGGGGGGKGRSDTSLPPSGIVYVLSRDESEHVSALLSKQGITSSHYHAGMTSKQRMEVQNKWRAGKIQCVVATIAFGMGIDKANVRWVAHYTLSKSLEGYYQEAGRAGRDGHKSICRLFYASKDISRLKNMIRMGAKKSREVSNELLDSMLEYCVEEKRCRHEILMNYFGDHSSLPRGSGCGGKCDNCALRLNLHGALTRSKPKKNKDPNSRGGGNAGGTEWGPAGEGDAGSGGTTSRVGGALSSSVPQVQMGFVKASSLPLGPSREKTKKSHGAQRKKAKGNEMNAATNSISSYFSSLGGGGQRRR